MPATEVVDLKRQAVRLAESVREAGALALSMFKTPLKNWTKGEALSPVSDADIAVDVLLRERLAGDGATIAWLSEESIDDPARLDARYVWIVDPIDGTRAYIAGLPDWAVSAALVDNGRPIAACLYAPVSEVTIAGHLFDMFASLTPANDLTFRYGTNAPTLRVEGLTVAGH